MTLTEELVIRQRAERCESTVTKNGSTAQDWTISIQLMFECTSHASGRNIRGQGDQEPGHRTGIFKGGD